MALLIWAIERGEIDPGTGAKPKITVSGTEPFQLLITGTEQEFLN